MTKTYRIWTLWLGRSEDTGLVVDAADQEAALQQASMMGTFSGLGRLPLYLGACAQEVA